MGRFDENFDSFEEFLFAAWCTEAMQYGFLEKYAFHDITFKLTEKKSITDIYGKKKTVRKHDYSPDFILFPTGTFPGLGLKWFPAVPISEKLPLSENSFFVDIKGSFVSQAEKKAFSINQKLVLKTHQTYVNMVTIDNHKYRSGGKIKTRPGLFSLTWAPARAFLGPKRRPSRKYAECLTIKQFLKKIGS